ncbi:hypothetical protein FHS26_006091 [Rhizobium pisi]|uniref:Uncharacterized protein n=1 Tax=Rhizobium pisi TaxID=574561 RepID=A0A3R9BFM0_9HYPH|nr:hypothetical protein [Rhizobium pisi]MBB3138313.1 hypothetical protein [Rhizobium pisi]RSB63443.1 hypothetical protein EFD55_28550 [Rhizobium pisi]TCA43465.1 hypothetical protein E0J16_32035 [Rhizobium pisi]
MIDKKAYNRRASLTMYVSVGMFALFRVALFVFDLKISPFDCLLLGIALAIGSFICNFRPDLDLAFQTERARASSEDEFTRLFKLAAGGVFLAALFVSGLIVVTLYPEKNPEEARLIAFLAPPIMAAVSPMFIAIFRLLSDSYRKI